MKKIAVGDVNGIRDDGNGESRNWSECGNKKLHGWEFDRFVRLLEYKGEEHGILIDRVNSSCETTMNADVNGAVNIRRRMTQSPPTEDMSNGCLAQPGVFLFVRESGSLNTREQGVCKP